MAFHREAAVALAAMLCRTGARAELLPAEAVLSELDDECLAAGSDGVQDCAVSAVQMRGTRLAADVAGGPVGKAATAAAWSQCGGKTWHGTTACPKGYVCQAQGDYYSQCVSEVNGDELPHGTRDKMQVPFMQHQASNASTTTAAPAGRGAPGDKKPANEAPYSLDWDASGTTFFDGWEFLWNDDNHGSAEYLLKDAAEEAGVAKAYSTHAILRAGAASPKYLYKRQTAKIETTRSWKYFLVTMKYTHLPYGCGVWPAFFTLGTQKEWPHGGEVDILEYVNNDVSKSSVHMGPGCVLNQSAISKYGDMPDRNPNDFDCLTDYSEQKLGCAPNKWMRTGRAWSDNRGVVALEWTEDYIKIFAIPEREIPSDLASNSPKPAKWDKWLFSYYPLRDSGCSSDMMDPQKLLLQINFCGDWAGKVWGDDNSCKQLVNDCRSVDPLKEYAPEQDCCTQYIWDKDDKFGTDKYVEQNAYFNISYLKVFTRK